LHLKFAQHARPLIIFASSQREDLIPFFSWGQSWGNPRKKQNEYFLYFLRNAGHKIDVTFVSGSREIWQLLAKAKAKAKARLHPGLATPGSNWQ